MQREYLTPVGVDLIGIVGPTWQIAGIRVDNPTGSWLTIDNLGEFVPPYTIGWATTCVPTRLRVNVRFTNSPSGQVSDPRGPAVRVVLQDTPATPSVGIIAPGQDSGAQSDLPKTSNLYKRAYSNSMADESVDIIPADTIPTIIIPIRVELRASMDVDEPLLGMVRGSWFYDPPVGAEVGIVSHVISPEHPSDVYDIFPGTFEFPANSKVRVAVATQPGQESSRVDAALFYYTLAANA